MKLLFVFGTRPEVIKLAPVINLAKKNKNFSVVVCNTGQHKEMLQQACAVFNISSDIDLNVMELGEGNLSKTVAIIISKLESVISQNRPDWIIVQGDTLSAFAGGLVGFYNQVKVAHVEAGLRSFDNYHPFPEEVNRKMIAAFAQLHFAPTTRSKELLINENIHINSIINTGNTVIDALLYTKRKIDGNSDIKNNISKKLDFINQDKNIILLTVHRRENHKYGLEHICRAVRCLAQVRSDIQIIFPVHLNPKVKNMVYHFLQDIENIVLTAPLDYFSLVYLLQKSKLVLTDSGGIQEEASAFSIPVLILRDKTERVEGVAAGLAKLVGTNPEIIIQQVNQLLDCDASYKAMCQGINPYGDGNAASKILRHLVSYSPASLIEQVN